MKHVVKGQEPRELLQHRLRPDANYDTFQRKDVLRQALVSEQGYLCAYCMGRIEPADDKMKIEHWRSQKQYPRLQLDYKNLFGVCKGGEGLPSRLQHCDTHKGDRDIALSPSKHPETYIQYNLGDGSIRSTDSRYHRDLDKILNLNTETLKSNRKAVGDAFYDSLKRRGDKGFTIAELEREQARLRSKDSTGKYAPYCQYVLYLLEKKLHKAKKLRKVSASVKKARGRKPKT